MLTATKIRLRRMSDREHCRTVPVGCLVPVLNYAWLANTRWKSRDPHRARWVLKNFRCAQQRNLMQYRLGQSVDCGFQGDGRWSALSSEVVVRREHRRGSLHERHANVASSRGWPGMLNAESLSRRFITFEGSVIRSPGVCAFANHVARCCFRPREAHSGSLV